MAIFKILVVIIKEAAKENIKGKIKRSIKSNFTIDAVKDTTAVIENCSIEVITFTIKNVIIQ